LNAAVIAERAQYVEQKQLVGKPFLRSLPGIEPVKGIVRSYLRPHYHVKYKTGPLEIKLSPLELVRSLETSAIGFNPNSKASLVRRTFALKNDDNEISIVSFLPGRFGVVYENGCKDKISEWELMDTQSDWTQKALEQKTGCKNSSLVRKRFSNVGLKVPDSCATPGLPLVWCLVQFEDPKCGEGRYIWWPTTVCSTHSSPQDQHQQQLTNQQLPQIRVLFLLGLDTLLMASDTDIMWNFHEKFEELSAVQFHWMDSLRRKSDAQVITAGAGPSSGCSDSDGGVLMPGDFRVNSDGVSDGDEASIRVEDTHSGYLSQLSTPTVAQSAAMLECGAAEEQDGCDFESARASAGVVVTSRAFERCLRGWETLRKCFESGLQLARAGATRDDDVGDGDVDDDNVDKDGDDSAHSENVVSGGIGRKKRRCEVGLRFRGDVKCATPTSLVRSVVWAKRASLNIW
jgi:hypothetical protein